MNDKIRGAMAGIQALNGMVGFFIALNLLTKSEGFSGTQIILLATMALSTAGFFAGFFLWRGHRLGFLLTAAFQFPQLLKIKSDLFIYQLELGAGIELLLFTKFGPAVTRGFRANFYFRDPVAEPQITINLIALLFLYLTYRALTRPGDKQPASR